MGSLTIVRAFSTISSPFTNLTECISLYENKTRIIFTDFMRLYSLPTLNVVTLCVLTAVIVSKVLVGSLVSPI